jgi:hypothetical protein
VNVLKPPKAQVDPFGVKTCEDCGLPAPLMTDRCALCTKRFPAASPTSFRLFAVADGYRWTVDGEEAATAAWRDGTWDITDADTGRVDVTIIPVISDGLARVALVDHRGRMAVTFTPTPSGDRHVGLGMVRDSHNEPMLLVRGDGPTGIHVIDSRGEVLVLASPLAGARAGLDVLMTGAGTERRRLVLGLTLAIALLQAGGLRQVA